MFKAIALSATLFLLFPSMSHTQETGTALHSHEVHDLQSVLKELTRLAENGDAQAQAELGLMYFFGIGVPKNELGALSGSGSRQSRACCKRRRH